MPVKTGFMMIEAILLFEICAMLSMVLYATCLAYEQSTNLDLSENKQAETYIQEAYED